MASMLLVAFAAYRILEGPADPPRATTQPVPVVVLSDALAASRVTRSGWEPRPGNERPNHTMPTRAELRRFLDSFGSEGGEARLRRKVTGHFTGTTDEIIQWAAWKWGIDEDVVRAVALQESNWRQSAVGDDGYSFGLMQVKRPVPGDPHAGHEGSYPLSRRSTAFNVDLWAATVRSYFDGHATWLNEVARGRRYRAGDIWGSVAAWYSGRWYRNNADYRRRVQRAHARRPWTRPGF